MKWRLNELEVWKKKYVNVIGAVVDLEKEVKGLKSEKIKEDSRRSEEVSREKKWTKKLEELEGQVKILKMTTKIIVKNDKLKEKTEMDENEAKEENRDKEREEPGMKETAKPKGENIQKNKQTREWPKGEILGVRIKGVWWESKIVKEVDEGIVISIPREPRTRKTENKWERETEKYRERFRENKKESESEEEAGLYQKINCCWVLEMVFLAGSYVIECWGRLIHLVSVINQHWISPEQLVTASTECKAGFSHKHNPAQHH